MIEKIVKILCPDCVDGKCYNIGVFGESKCEGECPTRDTAQELIDAGFVQVVRCGKCVQFEKRKGAKYGVCLYFSEICDTPVHMTADDYCSHGEEDNHETLAD